MLKATRCIGTQLKRAHAKAAQHFQAKVQKLKKRDREAPSAKDCMLKQLADLL